MHEALVILMINEDRVHSPGPYKMAKRDRSLSKRTSVALGIDDKRKRRAWLYSDRVSCLQAV